MLIWLCLVLIAGVLVLASSAAAQVPAQPCEAFTPCTQVGGPWVTTPSDGGNIYTVDCPQGTLAVGADAEFRGAIYPVYVVVGGATGLDGGAVVFGLPAIAVSVTYQPWVGCSPAGGITLQFRAQTDGTEAPYRTHVRTARIRPGRHVRVRLACARGERLVHSGSAVAFFTRRPPSSGIIKALEHRHRRAGSSTRTDVTAPAGVGDNERVELQVTAICSP